MQVKHITTIQTLSVLLLLYFIQQFWKKESVKACHYYAGKEGTKFVAKYYNADKIYKVHQSLSNTCTNIIHQVLKDHKSWKIRLCGSIGLKE
jgi:hypothetical protein